MSLNFEISKRRATQHPFVKSVQASLCLSLSLPDVSFPYSFFLPPPFFPPLLVLLPTHSPPADDFLSSRFNRPPSADCAVSLGPVIDIGYAVCELIAAWRGLIGRSPAKRRVRLLLDRLERATPRWKRKKREGDYRVINTEGLALFGGPPLLIGVTLLLETRLFTVRPRARRGIDACQAL